VDHRGPKPGSVHSTSVVWLSLLIESHSVLQMNGLAAQGRYEGSGDGGAAAQSLYIANHAY
jgi:hypothetical protein